MTDLAMAKAAKVLLNRNGVLGEDRFLPKVWMVGEEVCIYYNAAKRYQEMMVVFFKKYENIEEVTIEQAYEFIYHRPIPIFKLKKVVKDFNQAGKTDIDESINDKLRLSNDPRIQIKLTD